MLGLTFDNFIKNQTWYGGAYHLPAQHPIVMKDTPIGVEDAVALKYDSKMVICGGEHFYSSECYSYTNNSWYLDDFKLEPPRSKATSVEIRPGEWLIMGGYTTNYMTLNDTKLFKNGTFESGPDLPEPLEGGSSAMLNETHVFVAYTQKNYLLDINTWQWIQIANRTLWPSYHHVSGTFYDSTAGEIRVANIGFEGIEVYSPRADSWHRISFPKPLTYLHVLSFAIQRDSDSFIMMGGRTNIDHYSGDIYLFDENGFTIIKKNVLQFPRDSHVAMEISMHDFTCT